MGIKGIYGEIGPGERVALSKLAIEKFEQTNRPLRVAIDISIWQFQIQAGQGGTNPAIRTLYYRLLRLLSVSVQPLFVFDGPHKPPFKRNKKTAQRGAMVPNMLTKQLLKLFGFPYHIAPGEAEAECALLQQEGLVDAVLSEDVDTLMFGCGLTFRNWSSEGTKGYKTPTHISVYDSKTTKQGKSGLDREGMVLVALMSGGDYITEGIPGCGIKVACEAARAGFGKSLCLLPRSDSASMDAWRKDLVHEIQTNESKYFRTKHKALKIPDHFPDTEVLGYYTHPVVSSSSKLEKLKEDILWDNELDVQGLRLFVAEAFDWTHKIGARKFIRGLAPVLLVQKLRLRANRRDSGYGDLVLTAMNEMELVRSICGKRTHITSDGIPELRVVYHPLDIVDIDLDAEDSETEDIGRDGLAPVNDNDQIEAYQSDNDNARSRSTSPAKRTPSMYDPSQPDKLWIPETIAKIGIPLKVEDYEASLRIPKRVPKAKAPTKKATTRGGTSKGTMDSFVKVSKPVSNSTTLGSSVLSKMRQDIEGLAIQELTSSTGEGRITRSTRSSASQNGKPASAATVKRTRRKATFKEKPQSASNPWTLSNPNSSPIASSKITKSVSQPAKSRLPPQSPRRPKTSIHIELDESIIELSPAAKSPTRTKKQPSPSSTSQASPEMQTGNTIHTGSSGSLIGQTPSEDITRTPPSSPPELYSPIEKPNTADPDISTPPRPNPKEKEIISLSSPPFPSSPSAARSKPYEDLGSQHRVEPNELAETIISTEETSRGPKKKARGKKFLMLRDSLPGAWKAVGEEDVVERKYKGRGKAWRMSEVEVLDMCGDE